MSQPESPPAGPDFAKGAPLADIADGGFLAGRVGDDAVLLARRGSEIFAVSANCTHYGAPLADGLMVGEEIHCPWHHACFNLRTGEAVGPPALNDLACWRVEQRDGLVFVNEAKPAAKRRKPAAAGLPESVVIVGGGAAGNAAAETLRREGYDGPVTLLSADRDPPCDRPNLSKDFLAGTAEADWIPLRSPDFYTEEKIELRCATSVAAIDPAGKTVTLADGGRLGFGALLLATGAEPVRLALPGAELAHVHMLRTLADSEAVIAGAAGARRAVVIGASFIGLEAAASLRTRGLEVHVVAPEARPMERVLGPELGDMIRALHEAHGVVFHLGATPSAIEAGQVRISTGETLAAELVVMGVGVRPQTALAQNAGLAVDRGVVVDASMRTSAAGVWAAGDIARFPDPRRGQAIRVEHWAVAERQGQVAARSLLGLTARYLAAPFFWSQHYDVAINYVGHAERWDRLEIDGDPAAGDCAATFWLNGRRLAVATIGRDLASLEAEAEFDAEAGA